MGKGTSGTHHDSGGCCGCGTPPKNHLELNRPRSCSDIPMTIVFVLYMIGVAAIAGWAVENGDAERLIYGADSWGNVCGRASNERQLNNINSGLDLSNYKHQYYTLSDDDRVMCLASCPSVQSECPSLACINSGVCLGVQPSAYNAPINASGSQELCPNELISSTEVSFINRCSPIDTSNSSTLSEFTEALNAADWTDELLTDFYAAREVIATCLALSALISLGCITCMRCFAGIVVWTAILLSMVVSVTFTGSLWYFGITELVDYYDEPTEARNDIDKENAIWITASAAVVTIFTLLYICMMCAMRSRIKQAICVMKTTARALTKVMTIFCCPFITFALILGWIAVWIIISMYVMTADDVTADPVTGYAVYSDHEKINFIWAYMILALVWGTQFFLAALDFTVSSSMVIWYLSSGKPEGTVVLKSVYRLLRYHFGSIAYGSLLIAIIQIFRAIVEYLTRKLEEKTESCLVRFCTSCVRCCLWCFEKCIKWLNKNAYTEIAIWGDGFMSSACRALGTMSEFVPLVAVATGVEWLVVSVIKVSVTFTMGFVAYIWLESESEEIPLYGFVVAFIVVMSFLVVDSFTDVYEAGASALLLLVLEDYRDGRSTGKYYMTKDLQDCWPVTPSAMTRKSSTV